MQEVLYSRQTIIPNIGEEGQKKISDARVLVVGCGGLGAPVLYYLTAMGIGQIGLCDNDTVSMSNLNRQVLFTTADIGAPKAEAADKRIKALNPNLKTTVYQQTMDNELIQSIISGYDIIVDCLDNFETRFVLNDACINENKPFVHAGVEEYYGQLMTVIPGKSPCLRCLFPNGISNKSKQRIIGVIGPLPGILGSLQALEVVKYLLDMQTTSDGFITFDGVSGTMEKVKLKLNSKCFCQKLHKSNRGIVSLLLI